MTPIQHFLSFTNDLICILDEQGKIHDVNANWKNLFSVGPKQGISFLDLIHDESKNKIWSFFKNSKNSELHLTECRFTDFNGQNYWLNLKIRRIQNKNHYWCTLKDITQRRHIFSILDQISDSYNLGHWEYDSVRKEINWSLKIFEIFGLDPLTYKPLVKDMNNFFSLNDVKQFREKIRQQDEFDFTFQYTDKTGNLKWIKLSGRKDSLSDKNFVLKGILQDVTKETIKEIAQLSSNVELSSFEKGLDQFSIVARTDARGRIIHANEAFCRISKYSHEELLGQDHRLLNSGHHPKSFFKEMWECIQSGKNWRGEIKNQAKDGSHYWVDTIIIPIRDNEGVLKEILSFRFEITNFKRIQEENQILQNQLELLKMESEIGCWSYDFKSQLMKLDHKTVHLMNAPSEQAPSLTTFLESLDGFDELDFEFFLKDSLLNEYQTLTSDFFFRVKAIRNKKGEAIRVDGILSKKREEDFYPPLFHSCA
ncbi:PAS domain-containing protein [Peredibacter starrii]|uniref:PAS domain-containing protein n=1 Tax=Peredibacter starrii TaxID=28202 RepID=A0AAX4HNI9_9BACT|nr:PAS domain-containing protein [Peredibacter starrii]WPU64726.1 PAS domain-containing protein [Peredibacter starrii]